MLTNGWANFRRNQRIIMKFLLILTLITFSLNSAFSNQRQTSFDEKPNCEQQNGVWRQFGNSCANNCKSMFNEFSICAQAITYGCDCLQDRCYNEGECVLIDDYKIKYQKIVNERDKILEEQKRARKDDFLRNRQAILQKITTQPQEQKQQKANKNQTENQNNLNAVNDPNINNLPNKIANQPITKFLINTPTQPKISENFEAPPFFTKTQENITKSEEVKNQKNNYLELPNTQTN